MPYNKHIVKGFPVSIKILVDIVIFEDILGIWLGTLHPLVKNSEVFPTGRDLPVYCCRSTWGNTHLSLWNVNTLWPCKYDSPRQSPLAGCLSKLQSFGSFLEVAPVAFHWKFLWVERNPRQLKGYWALSLLCQTLCSDIFLTNRSLPLSLEVALVSIEQPDLH